jgi:type II secretory pathway pseudopilin PulG
MFRNAGDTPATTSAFTIIELLIVISIIIVLAGLILATSGYVSKKGARSRAEAEVAAMSAALENYKSDNGVYPKNATTDSLDARTSGDPSSYKAASLYLYTQLSGNAANRQPAPNAKSYFAFKPDQLSPSDQAQPVQFIRDPFGKSYGYSTAYQASPSKGYNPSFDLWTTGGVVSASANPDQSQWIKNW